MTANALEDGMPQCECGGKIYIVDTIKKCHQWKGKCNKCGDEMTISQIYKIKATKTGPINDEDYQA